MKKLLLFFAFFFSIQFFYSQTFIDYQSDFVKVEKHSIFSSDLQKLVKEYKQISTLSEIGANEYLATKNDLFLSKQDQILLSIRIKEDSAIDELLALGFTLNHRFHKTVEGYISFDQIELLSQIDNILTINPVLRPKTNVGSVNSEADQSLATTISKNIFGLDGTGVTIGILSDSYDNLVGEATGINSGDLPADGVIVLSDLPSGGSDEGRAMAELIHDVAPGADLIFHTAFVSELDFASGIQDLADAGCDIIVDDVRYFEEPYYISGPVSQAVSSVVQNDDVLYFSSAGNSQNDSFEQTFDDSGNNFSIGGFIYDMHDFDTGPGVDEFLAITVSPNSTLNLTLQWSDQYIKAGCPDGASSDIDIFLLDQQNQILVSSVLNNLASDPIETIIFQNPSDTAVNLNLIIGAFTPVTQPFELKITDNFETYVINEHSASDGQSTIYGHANNPDAFAIGASAFFNTPGFGVDPPVVNGFSSFGGQRVFFSDTCVPLSSPIDFNKPDFVSVDGVNNTFFGFDIGLDSDTNPNFFGTSASAPNLAAGVALVLQFAIDNSINLSNSGGINTTNISNDALFDLMFDNAIDMDDNGYDIRTGNGFVQIDGMVEDLSALLPVKLLYFDAYSEQCVNTLNWAFASPFNHDYFELEKSHDGIHFQTINQLNYQDGIYEYSIPDLGKAETVYYRLKQVDKDGAIDYSEIIQTSCSPKNNELTIYPNPVSELLRIDIPKLEKDERLRIIDTFGTVQLEVDVLQSQSFLVIDVGHLLNGFYFIEFNGKTETFVKQ